MSSPLPLWARRLEDMPGVNYNPPPGLDVSRLRYRDHEPQVGSSSYDGSAILDWPERDGEWSSASPASDHGDALYEEDVDAGEILRLLAECLELPGTPSDYHFLIVGAAEKLAGLAVREPRLLAEVERLCLLDLRLVQAREDIIRAPDRPEGWLHVRSFDALIRMYEQAGFLPEALEVALIAERYGQDGGRGEDLRRRLANDVAIDAV